MHTTPQTVESLRASINKIGQILPVYWWQNQILDGEKRREACLQLGLYPDEIYLETEEEARAVLWQLHPERALRRWPQSSAGQAAASFSARIVDVARVWQPKRKKPERQSPGLRTGQRCFSRLLSADPKRLNLQLGARTYAAVVAAAEGDGLSHTNWARAALDLCATDPTMRDRVRAHWLARRDRGKH